MLYKFRLILKVPTYNNHGFIQVFFIPQIIAI
jgi:hypothetical protein